VLLLFLALAVLCKLSVWSSPLTNLSGTAGQVDPFVAMFFLRWTPYAITHGVTPFTTYHLNYPAGVNVMWNTWMPAVGLAIWPVTALGGAVLAYNVVATAGLALAALFAFIAIRRYVHNRPASAVGGLLYGFSPYMAAQDGSHAQMVAAAMLFPLGLLLLDELLVRQRPNARLLGLLIGIAGVIEFFVLEEYFLTEVLAAVVLSALLAMSCRHLVRARLGYVLSAGIVAVVVVGAALAYPLWVQLEGPDRALGVIHDPTTFVTDLANLVVPTSTQLIAPGWAVNLSQHFTGNVIEWDGYLGVGLIAVVVATVAVRWRDIAVRSAGLFALVMMILSLGPFLHIAGNQQNIRLPWWIVTKIPLLRDILANRLMVYVYLAIALIVAVAIAQLWRRRRRVVWLAGLTALALVPLIPAPLTAQVVTVPAFFTSSAVDVIPSGTAVLTMPCPCPYAPAGPAWMTAADMRFEIVGGFFNGPPAGGQTEMQQLATALGGVETPQPPDTSESAEFLRELADNHIGAIVMAQVPHPAAAAAVLAGVVGFAPQETGGVALWLLHTSAGPSPPSS
jgi:hypothetical protein